MNNICKVFFAVGVELEVNISDFLRTGTIAKIESEKEKEEPNLPIDLFQRVENELHNLLRHGHINTFMNSKFYEAAYVIYFK